MAIVSDGWHVRSDKPVRLPPDSKPEPDQCVTRGSIRDYARRTPEGADVGLIVEVSDTSLDDDRMMALTYSASGIPVYWIINLGESRVEVYTDPTQPRAGMAPAAITRRGSGSRSCSTASKSARSR